MYRLPILIMLIGLYSCRDKVDEPSSLPNVSVTDSLQNEPLVDTFLTNETFQFFNNSGYTEFTQQEISSFDWSKFKLVNVWKEDSMLVQPFMPEDDFYIRYGRFLKYSPDSSMFIDLDSYNIEIRKNSQQQWVGSENGPDMEVSLIDLDTKEKRRLIFTGPGGSIEEGAWIDNETLILTGIQELGNSDSLAALVYKYHIPSSTFFLYEMEEAGKARQLMGEWRKKRLKDVRIR